MFLRTLLTVSTFICYGSALSQEISPTRSQQFAALPMWAGLWEGEVAHTLQSDDFGKTLHEALAHPKSIPTVAPPGVLAPTEAFIITRTQLGREPPYNAEWAKKYTRKERTIQTTPASAVKAGSIMACSWDFPEIMDNPFDTLFQIYVTPEETLFLFANGQARHLYTDRPHPSPGDLWPTALGNSVGHWEGATLLVDTVDPRPGPFIKIPFVLSPDLSENAKFVESIYMTDADTIQDDMTIEDPERLIRPWTVTLKFHRVKDLDRLIATDCSENNRYKVVNGKLTITTAK